MRRKMLMDASCPSNKVVAVTNRTLLTGLGLFAEESAIHPFRRTSPNCNPRMGVLPLFPLGAPAIRLIEGMAYFQGRLKALKLEPTAVTIEIAEDRLRVVAGRRHLGSWPLDNLVVQRTSVYRFAFEIEGDSFEFFPDDPPAFSHAAGAVIDLTEAKGRYGLKERIQNAGSA